MNSRQRFLETMNGGRPDHPPLFKEGIRDEVLQAWQHQGLASGARLDEQFHYDDFEEMDLDTYPRPGIKNTSRPQAILRQLANQLDPDDARRLPNNWDRRVREWKDRQHALFMTVHQGLLLTLGVEEWKSFVPAIHLLTDEPDFVSEILDIQARFAARLVHNILSEVEVDAAIFSEPIAGNHGSLISPRMYREMALSSYERVVDALERFGVPVVIWRSYANPRALIREVARSRFNAVWPCEAPAGAMAPAELRQELGPSFGLIGGIPAYVLYQGRDEIRRAVEAALPMVTQGRFIAQLDGRVREDVPYASYLYYRETLESTLMKRYE